MKQGIYGRVMLGTCWWCVSCLPWKAIAVHTCTLVSDALEDMLACCLQKGSVHGNGDLLDLLKDCVIPQSILEDPTLLAKVVLGMIRCCGGCSVWIYTLAVVRARE